MSVKLNGKNLEDRFLGTRQGVAIYLGTQLIWQKIIAETALIPIFETINMTFNISTRVGDALITKGDGSADIIYTPIKKINFLFLKF